MVSKFKECVLRVTKSFHIGFREWLNNFDLRKPSRLVLWIAFIASVLLMILDLMIGITVTAYLFVMCNAIMLFRLLGKNVIITLLHSCILIATFAKLVMIHLKRKLPFVISTMLIVPLGLVILLSVHFVVVRYGRNLAQRAQRAGIHAYLGLLTTVIYFWIVSFILKASYQQCIVEMFYYLIFLFIVLTPHFQSSTQAGRTARERAGCPISNENRPLPSVQVKNQHGSSAPSCPCNYKDVKHARSQSSTSRKSHCSCESQNA